MGAWRSGLALPLTMVRQAAALRYIGARPCPSLVTGTLFSDDGRATAGNLGQAGYQRRGSGWHDQPRRASPAEIRHDYVCRSITRVQRIASKPTISRRHCPKGLRTITPASLDGDRDKFERHLRTVLANAFGRARALGLAKVTFPSIDGVEVCRIEVAAGTAIVRSGHRQERWRIREVLRP